MEERQQQIDVQSGVMASQINKMDKYISNLTYQDGIFEGIYMCIIIQGLLKIWTEHSH